jgi:hypothetical protein
MASQSAPRCAVALDLAFAQAIVAHPAGRVVVLDSKQPRTVGLLANSPWPIMGEHPPRVMADAAGRALVRHIDATSGREVLCSIVASVESALLPLAAAPVADNFDGLWEFGGELAVISLGSESSAIARVGDLRVIRFDDSQMETFLRENTLVAEWRADGRDIPADALRMITDCLGRGIEPRPSRIRDFDPVPGVRFAFVPGYAVECVTDDLVMSLANTNRARDDAASDLASACSEALSKAHGPHGRPVPVAVVDIVDAISA